MPHNLSTFTDDSGTERHCLLSHRESPWHRLGQRIDLPVGSRDAIRLAGLDWSVAKKGLFTTDLDPVPRHVAVIRSDTKLSLGVVGSDWQPLQNRDLFGVLDSLAGAGPITYETAGALGRGETTWVLANLPDLGIRIGDDESRAYLLVTNGHSGNRGVTVAPTTVRVVCQNTLRMATSQIHSRRSGSQLERGFTIRHTKGLHAALADVAAAYQATRDAQGKTREAYESLARVPMTDEMANALFARAFRNERVGPSEADRALALRRGREERLRQILASPTCTVRGTKETAFALLQAVTEYVDHERPTRGEETAMQRFRSAQFGSGATVKAAAWSAILDLAGV